MMGKFNPYAKAIIGAILAGLGATLTALTTPGMTATEWVMIAIAIVSTLGAVWATDNKPAGTSGISETQLTITSSSTEPTTVEPPTYASGRATPPGTV